MALLDNSSVSSLVLFLFNEKVGLMTFLKFKYQSLLKFQSFYGERVKFAMFI